MRPAGKAVFIDAKDRFNLIGIQWREFRRQLIAVDHITSKAKPFSSQSGASVEKDFCRAQPKESAYPSSDVIDGKVTDAIYLSNHIRYLGMEDAKALR